MTAPITYDPTTWAGWGESTVTAALSPEEKTAAAGWLEAEHFGYEPLLCETFTDIESHAGTCYKAAGWIPLGLTDGNSRQRADFYVPNGRPKKLWIKPLRPDARERLCARRLAPEHAAGETIGTGAPLPLSAKQLQPLAAALRAVPDPRAKNRRNLIGPLLSLIALGLLCGGTSLSAIVRHAQRLTQAQLRTLGIRGKRRAPGSKVWIYSVPNYEVFRDLLCRIDLDAFARILSEWLSAHRGNLPSHLALDGKRVRGEPGTIVTLCDIDEKVPVAIAATTAPGGEQTCARDLLRRESTVLRTALLAPVRAAGHESLTLFHEFCAENRSKAVNLIAYQRPA